MKTIIVTILSLLTFLSSQYSFSQSEELEIVLNRKSQKGKVDLQTVNESYDYRSGMDEYSLEFIDFLNWKSNYGLKITKTGLYGDTEDTIFYSRLVNPTFVKSKKYKGQMFRFDLNSFNIVCCDIFRFYIVDSQTDETVRVFKLDYQEYDGP